MKSFEFSNHAVIFIKDNHCKIDASKIYIEDKRPKQFCIYSGVPIRNMSSGCI